MSQEPPEELARLLQAGRRTALSPEALDRIRAATLAPGSGPPPGGPEGWPGPPRSSLTTGRLWGLGGAGAGVGLAVALLVLSRSGSSLRPAPGPAASLAPAGSSASAPPESAAASASGAPDPATPPAEPVASAPRPAASGARKPERGQGARGDRDDPREGLLLLQARRALPTDPARALQLTGQHSREFPSSQLAYERQQIEREARQLLAR